MLLILKPLVTRFASNERGAVALVFALSCIVLMLVAGLAVDAARYQDLSTRMQQALDSATLAAAKMLADSGASDEEIRARANAYFNASIPSFGVKPTSLTPLDIRIDRKSGSVEIASHAAVPSFFGGIAALPKVAMLNKKSKVVFDLAKVELAMVLDITGSMNQANKLRDMQSAANLAMDTLAETALDPASIRVALAPYSAAVNVGPLAASVRAVPPVEVCSNNFLGWTTCKTAMGSIVDTCVIERKGADALTDTAPAALDKIANMTDPSWGNYICPPSIILPLTELSKIDEIKSVIKGYRADGSTAGHIGTQWGWYLLSPKWASVLPSESAPRPYDEKDVKKAMIIMTDGKFNTSYIGGENPAFPGRPLSDRAQQISESYSQFDSLCRAIKGKGITVYTVGFDLKDADALAHLASCASTDDNFYDVKTGKQLKDAFKAIADRLGNLRVAS